MMLTLDEAITRFKALSKANRSRAESYNRGEDYELMKAKECETCADECEQMASWLTELQDRREADRWISTDEALPDKEGYYLVDRKERRFSIHYFFFDTIDHKPYWPGECKVYAWRPLPEPYKESEGD